MRSTKKLKPLYDTAEMMRLRSSLTEEELRDKLEAEIEGPRRMRIVERLVDEIRRREREKWKAFIAALIPKNGYPRLNK
jgi:hypothetical protein